MFSYYGGKGNVVKLYPKPLFNKIIEPCAGSAKYSLLHFENDIYLYDKFDKIVRIWKHLQKCSEKDILSLPEIKPYQIINEKQFDCIEEFWLMGFMIVVAGFMPNRTVTTWGAAKYEQRKAALANNLFKIRHWKIECLSYELVPNKKATWFIDFPYQYGGHKYTFGNDRLDYAHCKKWSKERKGQVIVCENTKADWMKFKPLTSNRGIRNTTTEAIWTNF